MARKPAFWTDERIKILLACETRTELQEAFPHSGVASLVNKRAEFRKSRPDLAPGPVPEATEYDVATIQARRAFDEAALAPKAPKGWEAGVELEGNEGTLTTGVVTAPVEDWDQLLSLWDLDPAVFEVVEPVTFKAWDLGIKNAAGEIETKRLYSYKATVRRRVPGVDPKELKALRKEIRLADDIGGPYSDPEYDPAEGVTFVVCLADWQIGKGEGGGTEETVARIERVLDRASEQLETHLVTHSIDRVAIVGLGDLFESCADFYAMQEYQTDRTRREQTNIVRRLILRYIRRFAEFGIPLVVGAVAGNHGENRKGGKAYTTFGDNDDVAVFEQVKNVVDEAPEKYGVPMFHIAQDNLVVTLELSGVQVALAHGHQFGSGARKSINWWQKQALGSQPAGAASLLLSGHFHNFEVSSWSHRTHIQVPAIDGGSQWFREKHGAESPAGMLTLLVGSSLGPHGWSSPVVHT